MERKSMRTIGTIEQETNVRPQEIADSVIQDMEQCFDSTIPDRSLPEDEQKRWPAITTRQEFLDALVNRAEQLYQTPTNVGFRVRMKRNEVGVLRTYMRHWATALLRGTIKGEIISDLWSWYGQGMPNRQKERLIREMEERTHYIEA